MQTTAPTLHADYSAVALAALLLFGCHGSTPAGAPSDPAASSASAPAHIDVVKTQLVKSDPCAWISRANAERALGDVLRSEPARIFSAENPRKSSNGEACLYELRSADPLQKTIAIQIMADEPGLLQTTFSRMENVDPTLKGISDSTDDRWDFLSAMPGGLTALARGRIAMQLTSSPSLAKQAVALAGAVLDQIADLPFSQDASDASRAPDGRDPCALIPRAQAEAVLGRLGAAPYRSRTATAYAYGSGGSCTYFVGNHRALVVTPKWSHAKAVFTMIGSAGGVVTGIEGGSKDAKVVRGAWEEVSLGPDGALYALKGDELVAVQFKTANIGADVALKLLNMAYARL